MGTTEDSGFVSTEVRPPDARDRARRRLQERRDFWSHIVVFVVVNSFLIGVWAVTGAGYFWPIWVIASWGIGLVLHAWPLPSGRRSWTIPSTTRTPPHRR